MTTPGGPKPAESSKQSTVIAVSVVVGTIIMAVIQYLSWPAWVQVSLGTIGAVLATAPLWVHRLSRRTRATTPPDQPRTSPDSAERPKRSRLDWLVRLSWQVLIVGAALIMINFLFGWTRNAIADRLGPPDGATDAKLLAVVEDRLRSCARSAVASPINCPQNLNRWMPKGTVAWTLRGDPMEGAKTGWSVWSRTSKVNGSGVLVARFQLDGRLVEVVPFAYEATVSWNGGIASLTSMAGETEPTRAKAMANGAQKRTTLSRAEVESAGRAAFDRCVAVRVADLSPECPTRWGRSVGNRDFRWRIVGDPLLNASFGYDEQYGLATLSGDFAFRLTYYNEALATTKTEEFTGRYTAYVIDQGKPVVLRIAKV